jgi:ABC-type tungstate transport system permease subunit
LIEKKDVPEHVETVHTHHAPVNQDFMMSESAEQIICDPEFGKIYNDFMIMAEQADLAGEIMPNLP